MINNLDLEIYKASFPGYDLPLYKLPLVSRAFDWYWENVKKLVEFSPTCNYSPNTMVSTQPQDCSIMHCVGRQQIEMLVIVISKHTC